jgi:hypothetical protein
MTMLYKFKSKAAGNLIMFEVHGDQILRLIGKEPGPKGILTVAELPSAIAVLERLRQESEVGSKGSTGSTGNPQATRAPHEVSLAQRAQPFRVMLERSFKEGQEVVWGV